MKKFRKIGSKLVATSLSLFIMLSVVNLPVNASGKQQVTSALDFTTDQSTTDKLATEGWKWDYDADGSTLTLDGIDLNVSDSMIAITLPYDTTIVLVDGSENTVLNTVTGSSGISIYDDEGYYSTKGLTIQGN